MYQKQIQLEIFGDTRKSKKINPTFDETSKEVSLKYKFPTQFCIKSSCFIIAIIITFVLGIERGKMISVKRAKTPDNIVAIGAHNQKTIKENNAIKNNLRIDAVNKKNIANFNTGIAISEITVKDKGTSVKNNAVENNKFDKIEKGKIINKSKYIIQLATYKKNSSYIKQEISKLKQKGFSPFVMASDEYTIIYVGEFINKTEAQTQLNKLKQSYRDCLIKKI